MPPKKGAAKKTAKPKAAKPAGKARKQADAPKEEAIAEEPTMISGKGKDEAPADAKPDGKPSKKRKNAAESDEPQKAARRSGRGTAKSQPSQQQLLNYMLSTDAEELCRPEDESADIHERGDIRTYSSSALNPFEELLCAVVLSRPISHRLGLRSIRTILNEPYSFISAKAVQDAGSEKHHQALWEARTQHKAKTAENIGHIGDVVLSKFTASDDKEGTQLQKVRDDCEQDVSKERDYLQANIKGLGKTGLDIFFRRVQWLWTEAYPFVDERTMHALHKLGLPEAGEELIEVIEEHWSTLNTKQLAGDDEAARKRRALVTILERATGSDLEGKHEALGDAAATC
ncbi:hypothetical protein LTR36_006578 [Oleoguttula mirabilis]|uniref:Uncharacterized protein n=1 Tax=Oleoguttula mirabilis TaxID=1507867 RepID=A0AAV9JV78_9PEZI|nr:hypothetical protein LTR36_006578 [Oleoguttula mirabilis]